MTKEVISKNFKTFSNAHHKSFHQRKQIHLSQHSSCSMITFKYLLELAPWPENTDKIKPAPRKTHNHNQQGYQLMSNNLDCRFDIRLFMDRQKRKSTYVKFEIAHSMYNAECLTTHSFRASFNQLRKISISNRTEPAHMKNT